MKQLILNLLAAVIIFPLSLNAQVKYNESDFEDISNVAAKIAKVNAKNLQKHGVKKVMITEFFGDFVTSKETSPSAFEKRHSSWYLEKKQSVEMGSDYYETITNEVYELVVQLFEDNGIEVLEKETLLNNQDYIDLGLKEERKTRGYTGGVMKQSTTTKGIKRSVTGMGMYSETLRIGAIMKLNKMFPKIAKDNGCDAQITVKFKVGLGKKNKPTLDYLNAMLNSNLKEYNAGMGKKTYAFASGGVVLFETKKGLLNDAEIQGEDKSLVDLKKHHKAVMDQITGMCDAYSYMLKQQLGK